MSIVIVNKDFSVSLPESFGYQISQWDNDPNCAAVLVNYKKAPKDNQQIAADSSSDEDELYRIEFSVQTVLDGTAEVTQDSVSNALKEIAVMMEDNFKSKFGSIVSQTVKTVLNTPYAKAGYALINGVIAAMGEEIKVKIYHILVASKWALYQGHAMINGDLHTNDQETIEKLLSSIKESGQRSIAEKKNTSVQEVTTIKYNKNQYYTLGEIKLPVPDGMYYAASEINPSIPNGVEIQSGEQKYEFIVSGKKIDNPSVYMDSVFGYSVVKPQPFTTLSWFTNTPQDIAQQISQNLSVENAKNYGSSSNYSCLVAKRFFVVLWTPFKKSEDPKTSNDYWESITFSVITKSMSYHGTAFANGSTSKLDHTAVFQQFLNRIFPTYEEEINDDGLLENPLNLKNLIEAAGGTVVDWPGNQQQKDNLWEDNQERKMEEEKRREQEQARKKEEEKRREQELARKKEEKKQQEQNEKNELDNVQNLERAALADAKEYYNDYASKLSQDIKEAEEKRKAAIDAEKEKKETERDLLVKSIHESKEKLSTLNIFQGKQKKQLKQFVENGEKQLQAIEESIQNPSNAEIQKLDTKLTSLRSEYNDLEKKKKETEKEIKDAFSEYKSHLSSYYTYFHAPSNNKPKLLSNDPLGGKSKHLKELIAEHCALYDDSTISEMQRQIPELSSYSNQVIASLVRQLIEEGRLKKRTVGGKSVFSLDYSGTSKGKKEETVIDDRGWDIHKKPLPPTFDKFKNKIQGKSSSGRKTSTTTSEEERIAASILKVLENSPPKTLTEIVKLDFSFYLSQFNNQRIASTIRNLVESGKIEKTVMKGKSYFSIKR